MKIQPVGVELFYVETWTDMVVAIVGFSYCLAEAPKCGN